MTFYCTGCGAIKRPDGGYGHILGCPLSSGGGSWTPPANVSVRAPDAPIPADGALHRCYCGVPIWFEGRHDGGVANGYHEMPGQWREPDGTPHRCPKEARNG